MSMMFFVYRHFVMESVPHPSQVQVEFTLCTAWEGPHLVSFQHDPSLMGLEFFMYVELVIDRKAREIIGLVASVRLSVCLSVRLSVCPSLSDRSHA